MSKPFVFPEHLDKRIAKRPYKVVSSAKSSVDKVNRVMNLFGEGDILDDMFRHEANHIIISPKGGLPKAKHNTAIFMDTMAAIEDARVNLFGVATGLEMRHVSKLKLDLRKVPHTPYNRLMYAIAAIGTDVEDDVRDTLVGPEEPLDKLFATVKEALTDPTRRVGYVVPFEVVIELTEWLTGDKEDDKKPPEPDPDPSKPPGGGKGVGKPGSSDTPPPGGSVETRDGPTDSTPPEGPSKLPHTMDLTHVKRPPTFVGMLDPRTLTKASEIAGYIKAKGSEVDRKWEKMKVIPITAGPTIPAGLVAKLKQGAAISRCASEGSVIRRIDRLYSDGYIFRAPVKNRRGWAGGTILLDLSGSMGLEYDEILEFLVKAPYKTTVCGYGGIVTKLWDWGKLAGYDRASKPEWPKKVGDGVLVALAKKGKIVRKDGKVLDMASNAICYNVCDGPALEWLAQQPNPRIWISDGIVTGVSDMTSTLLSREAQMIVDENKIKRFGDVETFLSWMESGDDELIAGSIRGV